MYLAKTKRVNVAWQKKKGKCKSDTIIYVMQNTNCNCAVINQPYLHLDREHNLHENCMDGCIFTCIKKTVILRNRIF